MPTDCGAHPLLVDMVKGLCVKVDKLTEEVHSLKEKLEALAAVSAKKVVEEHLSPVNAKIDRNRLLMLVIALTLVIGGADKVPALLKMLP